jgi:CheY-like chemotaxis protein
LANEQKKSKCRIVVADDNPDSAASLAMMLRILGHDVQTAHNGQQAVELASTFLPDVMLLDIGMPVMDGYEAAQHVRKNPELAHIILVALTGWGQDDDKRQAEEAGFNHHVTKPIDLAALQSLLQPLKCAKPEHAS